MPSPETIDLTERVAKRLSELRKCDREYPCGFCWWSSDADEEMGCRFMAAEIMKIVNVG